MNHRLFLQTLDLHEIRRFLVKRQFLRGVIEPELFDAIRDRQWGEISGRLIRELSVFISGYKAAKP
jgi:hypothetical protein